MPITILNYIAIWKQHPCKSINIYFSIYTEFFHNILTLLHGKPCRIRYSDILKSQVTFLSAKRYKNLLYSLFSVFGKLYFSLFLFFLYQYFIRLVDIFVVDVPLLQSLEKLSVNVWICTFDELLKRYLTV